MKHPFWWKLGALLLVAFALRLAAGLVWPPRLEQRFAMGDSDGYWGLAQTIAKGEPYQYGAEKARVFRTPGYPLLLSPLLWLFGDNAIALALARAQAAVFGTLAVAAVAWLARQLFDDRAALIAAVLATFYPGTIVLSVLILSEAPFCPLMLLNLGLWMAAWQASTRRRTIALAIVTGVVAGAATMMRPSWLLFAPLTGAVGVLIAVFSPRLVVGSGETPGKPGRCTFEHPILHTSGHAIRHDLDRPILRQSLIFAFVMLGLVVVMLPWWIRNAWVVGRFVPTTLQVGASLYDGLSPTATGASDMEFVPRFVEEEHRFEEKNEVAEPFEVRVDQRMRRESLAWAKAHPGDVLRLAGVKFLRIWNVWPNEAKFSSWGVRLAVLFTYTPILFFAIIGVWRTLGRGWPYLLCWFPAVYFTMLHMIFVSSIRYRDPAMLALMVLAAGTLSAIGRRGTMGGEGRGARD